MPTFKEFDGIKIECYSAEHLPPHVHAKYAEYEALIVIETQELLTGKLPPKKFKRACEFVKASKNKLLIIFDQLNPQLKRDENK